MQAAAQAATYDVKDLTTQHIANIMWSFATLMFKDPETIYVLLNESKKRVQSHEMSSQQIANLVWSLSVLDALDTNTWQTFSETLAASSEEDDTLPIEASSQIYQATLIMSARHPAEQWSLEEKLFTMSEEAWKSTVQKVMYVDVALIPFLPEL